MCDHVFYCKRGNQEVRPLVNKLIRLSADNISLQALDVGNIGGPRHLAGAVKRARRNQSNGEMGTASLGMEVLVMISAQRQISPAIKRFGLDKNTKYFIVLVMIQDDTDIQPLIVSATRLLEEMDFEILDEGSISDYKWPFEDMDGPNEKEMIELMALMD